MRRRGCLLLRALQRHPDATIGRVQRRGFLQRVEAASHTPGLEVGIGLLGQLECGRAVVRRCLGDGLLGQDLLDACQLPRGDRVVGHLPRRGQEFGLGVGVLLARQGDQSAQVVDGHAVHGGQRLERDAGKRCLQPGEVFGLPKADSQEDFGHRILGFFFHPGSVQTDSLDDLQPEQDLDRFLAGPIAALDRHLGSDRLNGLLVAALQQSPRSRIVGVPGRVPLEQRNGPLAIAALDRGLPVAVSTGPGRAYGQTCECARQHGG